MRYRPISDGKGNFGILDPDGSVEYEVVCNFSKRTAVLACRALNAGRGLDGWAESEDPSADLLRPWLIEQGWSPAWDEERHTLNEVARATLNRLCTLMLDMNNRGDENADQASTYGHIHKAIIAFVLNETGIDISNAGGRHGWNLGGNWDYAQDIQVALNWMVDPDR